MIKHLNDHFLLLSQYIQWRTQEYSMEGGGGGLFMDQTKFYLR